MQELPFIIPPSLSSFVDQFGADPDKSIERLETHLKKLGMDAVGYFVLACMQHEAGNLEQAMENAQKARCFAPGSPLFANLQYFLMHPARFKAIVPDQDLLDTSDKHSKRDFDVNLESLISKLSEAETLKVKMPNHILEDDVDLSVPAQMVGDIASETLAQIHEKQGKYHEAIEAYEVLQKVRPKQADKYQKDIERIEELIKAEESKKAK